jgi:hypothetical protein
MTRQDDNIRKRIKSTEKFVPFTPSATENINGSNRQHPRGFEIELSENRWSLKTTVGENETTLFENRPNTSGLDHINENS